MDEIRNWDIHNNNPDHWCIENQMLKVQVSEGNIWGCGSAEVDNIFVRAVEQSDYAIQVDINVMPKRIFEQAGLGVYWDNNNYIKISKEMFNGRLSLVFVTEQDGNPQVNQLIDYPESDVTVRLEKKGGYITALYKSQANESWNEIGKTPILSGQEQGVMLYTFSGNHSDPTIATFENFALDYL